MSTHESSPRRIVAVGLGPIGLAAMRSALADPSSRLVAAVDIRADLVGRDAGELAGLGSLGVPVVGSLEEAGAPGSADVILLSTGSHLVDMTEQIVRCVGWGAAVVSSCEELSYPWFHHPEAARTMDEAALRAGRAIIGTGVNPGFAMDALALAVSGIVERVDGVEVNRVVDAATRRGPLQLKVGAGISVDEFAARKAAGRIGHVGLVESAAMIGAGLGWPIDRVDETLDPVTASEEIITDVVRVAPGDVAGIHQRATAVLADREVVRLDLQMYVGAPDPGDHVRLQTEPPIVADIHGLHGDLATAAIMANVARTAPLLQPGLRTMLDVVRLASRGGPR